MDLSARRCLFARFVIPHAPAKNPGWRVYQLVFVLLTAATSSYAISLPCKDFHNDPG